MLRDVDKPLAIERYLFCRVDIEDYKVIRGAILLRIHLGSNGNHNTCVGVLLRYFGDDERGACKGRLRHMLLNQHAVVQRAGIVIHLGG